MWAFRKVASHAPGGPFFRKRRYQRVNRSQVSGPRSFGGTPGVTKTSKLMYGRQNREPEISFDLCFCCRDGRFGNHALCRANAGVRARSDPSCKRGPSPKFHVSRSVEQRYRNIHFRTFAWRLFSISWRARARISGECTFAYRIA